MTWPATQSGTDMDQPGLCQGGLAWISNKEEDLHSNKGGERKFVSVSCFGQLKLNIQLFSSYYAQR